MSYNIHKIVIIKLEIFRIEYAQSTKIYKMSKRKITMRCASYIYRYQCKIS